MVPQVLTILQIVMQKLNCNNEETIVSLNGYVSIEEQLLHDGD